MKDFKTYTKGSLRSLFVCLVVLLSLTLTHPAFAETDVENAQNKVEQTAKNYDAALKKYNDIQAEIDTNEKQLKELQEKLPELQNNAGKVIHTTYKMGKDTPNLISIILTSDNFSEFLSTMHQLEVMQGKYMKTINELNDAQNELKEKTETLSRKKAEAKQTLDEAQAALKAATDARVEAQKKADEKLASEKSEAEAAVKQAESASGKSFTPTNSDNSVAVEVPRQVSSGPVDWSVGRDQFVYTWSHRIDSYLAGSPMAGSGQAFAEAAWDNGVDPRWSPAIATIESTKGRFVPYGNSNNAWGWTAAGGGFRRFGSFSEGARAHVNYLANVYGSTLTPSAAKTYVGTSHWSYWYSSVLAQMEQI